MQQPTTVKDVFRRWLRDARDARKWTQKQLAAKAKLSQSYLSEVEQGDKWVPAEAIDALCRAFGLSVGAWLAEMQQALERIESDVSISAHADGTATVRTARGSALVPGDVAEEMALERAAATGPRPPQRKTAQPDDEPESPDPPAGDHPPYRNS